MASPARFERATFRLGGGCSIQLSYGDIYSYYEEKMKKGGSSTLRLGGARSIQVSYGGIFKYQTILINFTGTVKEKRAKIENTHAKLNFILYRFA